MNHPGFNGFFRGITGVFDLDVVPGQRRSFLWPEPRSKGESFYRNSKVFGGKIVGF